MRYKPFFLLSFTVNLVLAALVIISSQRIKVLMNTATTIIMPAFVSSPTKTLEIMPLQGTSMLPVIKTGDHVLIDKSIPYDSLEVGDIIAFTKPSDPNIRVLHLVTLKSSSGEILTIGCGNHSVVDQFVVNKKHYIGKAISVAFTWKDVRDAQTPKQMIK